MFDEPRVEGASTSLTLYAGGGEWPTRMVARRCSTAETTRDPGSPTFRHVPPHCTRRNADAEFELQFRGNPFHAPLRIRTGHGGNSLLDVRPQRWSAGRPRFPPPKEPESFAMPMDQRVRLHDRQHCPPVDQTRQPHERDPRRILSATGFDLTFSVESQLRTEKEILRDQLGTPSKATRHESDDVEQHGDGRPPHR
jgi:hypothetical protein